MSNKQVAVIIVATTALALVLAWTVERAQVRRFMSELDTWWEGRNVGRPTAE